MVKSTIDDIKDITLERQIRKLAGVIDKQNEVIGGVGDVNARLTAVEDSTTNNTVQINSVKVDVAKNTTAIENISNRVTNVEQSTEAIPGIQTEIDGINKSLVSGVTATFDNPSRELKISLGREASPSIDATVVIPASSETGQYSAGNGITIQDYQIAVDTGVVALKTDIPVVPDVTEINNRLDNVDAEITGINNKNTEQDTAIAGKVAISQGIENAGKVLGIGSDGNVTPVDGGGSAGGGEVWEEVDLNNWPTDWIAGDKVRIIPKVYTGISVSASTWQSDYTISSNGTLNGNLAVSVELTLINDTSVGDLFFTLFETYGGGNARVQHMLSVNPHYDSFNTLASNVQPVYNVYIWNGKQYTRLHYLGYSKSSIMTNASKIYRCRAST